MFNIGSAETAVTLCAQYAHPICGNYGAFGYICTELRIYRSHVRDHLRQTSLIRRFKKALNALIEGARIT